MTVSLEDQTSVINLFNFVREIYDIKRPFNGNIENRYVSWDDINPNLPGITKWPDLNSDPNLLCIIERLPHPERPAPASELSEWLLHGNGDEISFRESLEFKEVDQDGNEVLTSNSFPTIPTESNSPPSTNMSWMTGTNKSGSSNATTTSLMNSIRTGLKLRRPT